MEKNVKATQKLLQSLKTLPSFQQLKDKHLSHLLALIGKSSSIEIGPASELVDSLDGSVWSEQDLVTLKSAINQKITSEVVQGTRRPLQNYCALPRYLTQDQWTFMQTNESQEERVEKAVSLAGSLGLRCPSETTTACIVWVACCAFRGQEVSDHLKYQCLQEYKAKIKKWLSGLPPPAVYLTELPTDVQALPDVLRAVAFPTGHGPGLPGSIWIVHWRLWIVSLWGRQIWQQTTAASSWTVYLCSLVRLLKRPCGMPWGRWWPLWLLECVRRIQQVRIVQLLARQCHVLQCLC